MEEPEVPLEDSQEHIQHHALHGEGGEEGGRKKWVLGVALSSAMFAAMAAVASLHAGHHANEAIVAQIKSSNETIEASDKWSEYQAKGIKSAIAVSRITVLKSLDKVPDEKDLSDVGRYAEEQKEIMAQANERRQKAKEFKEEGEHHLEKHVPLSRAVTMFQVSIAVAAISVLTGRRFFWWLSLAFGAVGIYFAVLGFLH